METKERANALLYQKISAEQEKFKTWLLSQPPEEILHHANEYVVREDIIMWFDANNLKPAQANALLKSPCPLQDICKTYMKMDADNIDMIREAVITRVDRETEKLSARAKSNKALDMER